MILARQLLNKTVLLSDGTVVGTIHSITFDYRTGTLVNLIVKPKSNIRGLKEENGYYVIPFESVRSASDYVVIDLRRL